MEAYHLTSKRFITLFLSVIPFLTPVFSQYLATQGDFNAWLATTNAVVRYIGEDFNAPLGQRDARIVYCTEYDHDKKICGSGGECFAYRGPVDRCMKPEKMYQCLAAFNTNVCLGYDNDCTLTNECIFTTNCEDKLANGFCLGIDSVSIGFPDTINNPRQPLPQPSQSSSTPPAPTQPSSTSSSTPSSASSASESSAAPGPSSDSESNALPTTRRSASFETFLTTGSGSSPSSSSTGSTLPGSSNADEEEEGERREGSSLPIGGMVGIALGGVLVGIAIILLGLCIRRRRRRAQRLEPSNLPVILTPVTATAQQQPSSLDSPPIGQYYSKSYHDSPNPDSAGAFLSDSETATSGLESYRDHSDSGVRLASPARQQGTRTTVELPPPYSQA